MPKPTHTLSVTGTYGQMLLACDDCGHMRTVNSGISLDDLNALAAEHWYSHIVRDTLDKLEQA